MELELPSKLRKALEREAADARRTLHAHILRKLEGITPTTEHVKADVVVKGLPELVGFLKRIPHIRVLSFDSTPDAYWWVKFSVDIDSEIAWKIIQELGFVLNYISLGEKLPTVFMPVSPPPFLNGGPEECLAWVIEPKYNYIDPAWIAAVLEDRLPSPVEDLLQWEREDGS